MRIPLHPILLLAALLLPAWAPSAGMAEGMVLVVPKAESVQFWEHIRQGAMDASVGCGIEVVYRGPLSQESPMRQRAIIEQGVAEGVDAVVLAPSSATAFADMVGELRKQGIPLVVIDSALSGDGYVSFIATDNREAGRTAARFLLSRIPAGGPILLLRHIKGGSATEKREEGFATAVESSGGNVLLSDYLGISEGNAYRRALDLLRAHPEVSGVFASAETATLGCIRAIRELGLTGKIQVVGFDDTPDIRRALEDGVIQGVMVQQPYRMGRIGVETACKVLEGKPVPRRIVTKAVLVTAPDGFEPYTLTNP